MKKLTAIIIGYGMRGQAYARYSIDHTNELDIVGVAEAEKSRLDLAKKLHNIPDDRLFVDWSEIVAKPKLADFAIIATQDNMHLEPAIACIEKGYDILLEKPMAPTAKECKLITEAAKKKGVKIVVCHVLRFTNFWYKLKDIIDNGEIGKVMSVIHTEEVGNTHQAHSFVRGNWRNSSESAPMILAKSCHDTDILQWLIGDKCKKVQSFGSLGHFNKENQPVGAPDRCTDGCPHADKCAYNPISFYVDNKENVWRDTVADKVGASDEEVLEALKTGPYGRCVYACDNDVVDHQVVNMEFVGGCTVSFTMSAFNKGGRNIRLYGTKGEINASMTDNTISVYSFETEETVTYELEKVGETIASGHGGGDTGIMVDTTKYFRGETPSKSVCDIHTSYMNHLISFAAEQSRLTDKVIDLERFSDEI